MEQTGMRIVESQFSIAQQKRIVEHDTRMWWRRAHEDNTPYHQQFRGYCHLCQEN